MHLRVDEQSTAWQVAQSECLQAGNELREIDQHFAEIGSASDPVDAAVRRVDLPELDVSVTPVLMPTPIKRKLAVQLDPTLVAALTEKVETLQRQLVQEREQFAALLRQWQQEKKRLAAYQQELVTQAAELTDREAKMAHREEDLSLREEKMAEVVRLAAENADELKQLQASLETKEQDLASRYRQQLSEAEEREQLFDARMKSLAEQERKLAAQRFELTEFADTLQNTSRRLEAEGNRLEELQSLHNLTSSVTVDPLADVPVASDVGDDTSVDESGQSVSLPPSDGEAECLTNEFEATHESTEGMRERAEDAADERESDTAGNLFEEMSLDHLAHVNSDPNKLVERLLAFHKTKRKRWLRPWR